MSYDTYTFTGAEGIVYRKELFTSKEMEDLINFFDENDIDWFGDEDLWFFIPYFGFIPEQKTTMEKNYSLKKVSNSKSEDLIEWIEYVGFPHLDRVEWGEWDSISSQY